ncbi:MAG: TVP38/TMEM64 family protein [Tistlia sp.]
MSERPEAAGGRRGALRRLLPLTAIVGALVLVLALDLHSYLSLEALRAHREALTGFVADNALLAALGFMALYALATALSVPGGLVLTVAGGFLFGALLSTAYVVVSATLGATAIFLAARTALGDSLRRRAGPWLARTEAGFKKNAFSYLLVLRLIPLFPFFVVNLVPAFLGVGLRTYVVATFFGIVPGTYVYALVGAGLGSVLEQGGEITLAGALTPQVIGALVGLALLSLLPVAYKRWRGRNAG